jgi:hypothetical protein
MYSNTARYSEKWVRFWFTQRRTRCAGKKSIHYTILILVALVQKWHDARKISKSTQYAFLRIYFLKSITNYTVLEMPPKGFSLALFDMHIAENIGFENLIS